MHGMQCCQWKSWQVMRCIGAARVGGGGLGGVDAGWGARDCVRTLAELASAEAHLLCSRHLLLPVPTPSARLRLLLQVGRGKKYVAEFVDDEAKCGFWEDITAGLDGRSPVHAINLRPAKLPAAGAAARRVPRAGLWISQRVCDDTPPLARRGAGRPDQQ